MLEDGCKDFCHIVFLCMLALNLVTLVRVRVDRCHFLIHLFCGLSIICMVVDLVSDFYSSVISVLSNMSLASPSQSTFKYGHLVGKYEVRVYMRILHEKLGRSR